MALSSSVAAKLDRTADANGIAQISAFANQYVGISVCRDACLRNRGVALAFKEGWIIRPSQALEPGGLASGACDRQEEAVHAQFPS
jgi:hypothetical protein